MRRYKEKFMARPDNWLTIGSKMGFYAYDKSGGVDKSRVS
jgi:hypothetical protein